MLGAAARWPLFTLLAVACGLLYLAPFNPSPFGVVSSRFESSVDDDGYVASPTSPQSQRRNNGLTDAVEWDADSLFIHGQRVFIW
ncbi:hypothetical protein DL93DRAFT_2072983 [Clavulina sp. PMI_390]|nr:hypothetical protein DL93DRAFT_2072983 [Clavulina sp. PMI_390]